MASPLSNGVSGLLAAQRAIATSSHNVANANTIAGACNRPVYPVCNHTHEERIIFDCDTGI